MTAPSDVQSELEALRAELRRSQADASPPAAEAGPTPASEGAAPDFEPILRELQAEFESASRAARDLVATHPLAAAAAAFVLGVALGRALGGRR